MNRSKTSLFLMELIIAILFFSLSCGVCIQLFFKAHQLSNKSENLSSSVLWCENIAELFYGCDGNVPEMIDLLEKTDHFSITSKSEQEFVLEFDQDWNPITDCVTESIRDNQNFSGDATDSFNSGKGNVTAKYRVQCVIKEDEDHLTAIITAFDGSVELYSITSNIY